VDPTLTQVIDRYIAESKKQIGRTKTQVLRTIKSYDIADMRCSKITSADLISFAQALPVSPQTPQNYLSHLAAIFAIAKPAWGYPLDQQASKDAFVVAKRLGVTAKGGSRDRRPTLEELDRLLEHFGVVKARRPDTIPMQRITCFAIFSTRRQEEITTIRWNDYEKNRVLVREMKHPGDKVGNNMWCDLTPEASAIVESMPRTASEIFHSRPTRSPRPSLALAKCSALRTCTSMIFATKACRDCSIWAGPYRRSRACPVIEAGPA
jgi:integrase